MTNPSVTINPKDGGLGTTSRPTKRIGIIGATSAGTALEVLHTADANVVQDVLGRGKTVDFASWLLNQVPALAVDVVKAAASTAGTTGTVTETRVGSSDGTVTVAGGSEPNDDYEFKLEVLTSTNDIATGDGEFRLSYDGGDTWSGPIAIPTGGTYQIAGTGVSVTFANGVATPTFEDGDVFTIPCTAPGMATTDVGNAWNALVAEPFPYNEWRAIFVVGNPTDAAASVALASTVDTKVQALAAASKWTRVFVQSAFGAAEDETDLAAAFAAFSSTNGRVGVCAYDLELESALDPGRKYRRGLLFEVGRLVGRNPLHTDLGQVMDEGDRGGPLRGVAGIYDASGTLRTQFETQWQALDTARFITPRTWPTEAGFFLTQGNMMSPDRSDYSLSQFGFIMDVACRKTYKVLVKFMNKDLRRDPKTGFIDPRDAGSIDALLRQVVTEALVIPDNITAVVARVRRDVVIGTSGLQARVYLLPKDYVKEAAADIAFVTEIVTVAAAA